jgi:hypothetical protein
MEAKIVTNNAYPALCGGTYFTLLLEARGQRINQRGRYDGERDGLSQPDVLAGLGKVVYPEYTPPANKQTFRTNANAYKSCSDNGSNLSFLFPDRVSAFDKRVRNEYAMALKATCEFVDKFLEVGTSIKKEEWLVKALLELIEADISIKDSQVFFICSDGKSVTKGALRSMSDFVLQPLLLGVWHFVVVSQQDNKSGKNTFDAWCPPKDRAERKYEGNVGTGIKRTVNAEVLTIPTDDAVGKVKVEADPAFEDEPSVDYSESFAEEPAPDPAPSITNQIINAPAVFFNSGANAMQINNTGTLNIDRGGKI